MEANKRSGIALLVLLVAVSCLANLSSARTHPCLDFLDRVIDGERGTAKTCNLCSCPLQQTSSSGDEDKICYCMDVHYACPKSCINCEGVSRQYQCLDMISPDQCKLKWDFSSEAKGMIKLPKAMNELSK